MTNRLVTVAATQMAFGLMKKPYPFLDGVKPEAK